MSLFFRDNIILQKADATERRFLFCNQEDARSVRDQRSRAFHFFTATPPGVGGDVTGYRKSREAGRVNPGLCRALVWADISGFPAIAMGIAQRDADRFDPCPLLQWSSHLDTSFQWGGAFVHRARQARPHGHTDGSTYAVGTGYGSPPAVTVWIAGTVKGGLYGNVAQW